MHYKKKNIKIHNLNHNNHKIYICNKKSWLKFCKTSAFVIFNYFEMMKLNMRIIIIESQINKNQKFIFC
jgi:hypothetical protein